MAKNKVCEHCSGGGTLRCENCSSTDGLRPLCPWCWGGEAPISQCSRCGGTGELSFDLTPHCLVCQGSSENPCPACGGKGVVPVQLELSFHA